VPQPAAPTVADWSSPNEKFPTVAADAPPAAVATAARASTASEPIERDNRRIDTYLF
jgi:hypothetical protein